MTFGNYSCLIVMALACLARAQQCITKENQDSGSYTYHICTDNNMREFDDIQSFCKRRFREDSHIVTFPNRAEYEFLLRELNSSVEKDFTFYIGVYQEENKESKYTPQTGKYYWINDAETQITNNSKSHWQPIADWITGYNELTIQRRQYTHFFLNIDGEVFPVTPLRSKLPSDKDAPGIICMMPGTSQTESPKGTVSPITSASIELWIIIIIIAGGVLVLVIIGLAIGCVVSKKCCSKKFEKVPSKDPHETNHNHIKPEQV